MSKLTVGTLTFVEFLWNLIFMLSSIVPFNTLKVGLLKQVKNLLVLMSFGKYKRNLFYIVKQYNENLKQVKQFLKSA